MQLKIDVHTSDFNEYMERGSEGSIHLLFSCVEPFARRKQAEVRTENVEGLFSKEIKRPRPVVRSVYSTCSISPDGKIMLTWFNPFFDFFFGSIRSYNHHQQRVSEESDLQLFGDNKSPVFFLFFSFHLYLVSNGKSPLHTFPGIRTSICTNPSAMLVVPWSLCVRRSLALWVRASSINKNNLMGFCDYNIIL